MLYSSLPSIPRYALILLLSYACGGLAVASELTADQLFDSARLLEVEIQLPPQDWATLRTQSRGMGGPGFGPFSNPTEKPFSYFKGDVTINGVAVSSVGIRKKGFIGSLDETRPSLKIKFSEYLDQQPVDGLDRLTLNNNKQDTALVSQFLSYKVFNDAGVHAPRVSFAKVTVNGEYLGIYSNIESVKQPFLKSRYGDGAGNLYEGTLADFYPKALPNLEAKSDTKASDDPDVRRLAELLAADAALPMDEIEKLVDVPSFLKYWAVESLLGFWDGYTQNQNNFFVYDNPANGKFYFMPWGADSCFSEGRGPFGGFGGGSQSVAVRADAMLPNRLFHSEGMPDRYKQAMLEVLRDAWNEEALLAEVDRIEKLVAGSLHDDQEGGGGGFGRWPGRGLSRDGVRSFIKNRREKIQDELEDEWPPADIATEPRKPMYTVEVGSMSGQMTGTWSTDADSGELGEVTDAKFRLFDESNALKDVSVRAHPQTGGFGGRGFGGRGPEGRGPEGRGPEGRGPGGRRQGGPEPSPPANIVIRGKQESGEPITVTLMVSQSDLASPQAKPISVSGFLSVGEQRGFGFGFGPPSGQMVDGKLRLSKSGVGDGDVIEGKFDLRFVEMRGGMMDRFRGGGRRRGRGRDR